MKTKYLHLTLCMSALCVMLLSVTSCGDDNKPDTPIALTLSTTALTFEADGGQQKVSLTTYREWKVRGELPVWIELDKEEGSTSSEITIIASANALTVERKGIIEFEGSGSIAPLSIEQKSKDYKNEINWSPFFYNLTNKSKGEKPYTTYTFEGNTLFVSPSIRSQIFVGNVISSNLDNRASLKEYKYYKPKAITVSSLIENSIQRMEKPSKEATDQYAEWIIESGSLQPSPFSYNYTPAIFHSYKELHLLGASNAGINLDEVISGASYKEKEMTKAVGLIYTYMHGKFDITMDMPDDGKLFDEAIKDEDNKDGSLSYINKVVYGVAGMLVFESDHPDAKELTGIINKKLDKGDLSEQEADILSKTIIYDLSFDRGNTLKKTIETPETIHRLVPDIDKRNVYPIGFEIANAQDNGMQSFSFSLPLP